MTKDRIYALQWFHDRGEVGGFAFAENPPSNSMMRLMIRDGQLAERRQGNMRVVLYFLTDKGRRDLHEATR